MDKEWQTTRTTIRERNQYMYNNAMFSDVQFSVVNSKGDTVTVPAHKYVLAISSPVFQAMFYGEMAETQRTIDLPDCTAEGLLELFRYMYYDEVQLTGSHVMEVLYLAKKYIVPSLGKKCTQYLEEELGPEDVFNILPQTLKLEDKNLQQLCWKIVESETQRAVTSEAFLDVTQDVLCEVLERNTLTIKEVELFKAVDRWASKETDVQGMCDDGKAKRNVLGNKALHLIRFPIMSQKEFAEIVLKTGILNMEEVTELVQRYSSVPSSLSSFVTKIRGNEMISSFCKRFTRFIRGWTYSNQAADCIAFRVNKEICLTGVRLCGICKSQYSVKLRVYGRGDEDAFVLYHSVDSTFISDGAMTDGYYGYTVAIETPVRLLPGAVCLLKAMITGESSSRGEGGCEEVECGGVVFTFVDVSPSGNGTTIEKGQFPELLFCTE